MSNYKRLENGITARTKKEIAKRNRFIKNGTQGDKDHGIRCYSTELRWEQYKAGTLTRSEAVAKAQKRGAAQLQKQAEQAAEKLSRIEAATPTKYIDISIEWKRSAVWGYNPTAKIRTQSGIYIGTASGCGYDKESAAVAEGFNAAPEILTYIYKLANGNKNIPYGANYKNMFGFPFFDGGVGMSSFIQVLTACGFKLSESAHSSKYDYYYFTI